MENSSRRVRNKKKEKMKKKNGRGAFKRKKFFDNNHLINTNSAMLLFKKHKLTPPSRSTLIKWTRKYKMGKKLAGRWLIDKNKLVELITGSLS